MGVLIKLGFFLFMAQCALAENIFFSSSDQQTSLIELYSSEGCSSCPPADQFLSQFKSTDGLWEKYIPMAFHVDYWDYIGWKDEFASAAFSDRQRRHKQQGNISSVYTPGFVINGEEWAGFFKPWRSLPTFSNKPGQLKVSINRHQVLIEFPAGKTTLNYNLAIVGMGLVTQVQAGENSGHQLAHDFVVLNHQVSAGRNGVSMNLPLIVGHQPQQYALIAWVSEITSLRPIQAVGGYLPEGTIKSI